MVIVGLRAHLGHDSRTHIWISASFTIESAAQVLHATHTIDHIVLRMDPSSHPCIGSLIAWVRSNLNVVSHSTCPRRTFLLRCFLRKTLTNGTCISRWTNLSRCVVSTCVVDAVIRILVCRLPSEVSFFFHESSLLSTHHVLSASATNSWVGLSRRIVTSIIERIRVLNLQ